MARIVLVVDCSASMGPGLTNIKNFLNDFLVPWLTPPSDPHEVGLIYFDHDVYIGSHYTTSEEELQTAIGGLTAWGRTAFHDAIHVAIAFAGNPYKKTCPDILFVFSDKGDNSSCTDEDNWIAKIKKCNIRVGSWNLEPFDNPMLRPYAKLFTKKPIKPSEALASWRKLEKRTKRVKILEKPEDLLELIPKKR